VEQIHFSPDILVVHDLITDRESFILRTKATDKIKRGRVGLANESYVTEARVGKVAWFQDGTTDHALIVSSISQRIGDVTRLNVTYPVGEPLQLSNYGIGGHYEPHFDSDETRSDRSLSPTENIAVHGDRIATVMIYLNDVLAGGATVFPKINLSTRPIKNAAVIWYNYKKSGDMDFDTVHAGCPVLIGEKWVANKWIREFGQEFNRPCDINREL
jgi:prolyl 4-hydroxylase